jgi:glycosyltransferase involved in cell wall biosynthesis
VKTLIVQDYLRCGGTERHSVHLARHLRGEGSETSVLTFRPDGLLAGELALAGVSHVSLQPLDTGFNFFAPGLFRAVRAEQPDVILCMGRMANCYGGLIQHRFSNIAVVGTVRTGKPLSAPYIWSLRQVSGILTNTDWWRARLIEQGFDPCKIAVVANGLTHDWVAKNQTGARNKLRRRLAIKPSTVVFLNVADFRRGKRQAHLIEIFSTLDPGWDCQLWLVGSGKEWGRCQRLAERLGSGRVRLLGHSADPLPWYAAADVAVSASVEDSMPNFLIEAQMAGLPVITMDFQGVGEVLRDGKTGYLVAPHDRDALRATVCELYLRSEARRRMGRLAETYAREKYGGEYQVSMTREVLRTFVSLRPRKPPLERTDKNVLPPEEDHAAPQEGLSP